MGLRYGIDYEFGAYFSKNAASYLLGDLRSNILYVVCDTKDEFYLFNQLRHLSSKQYKSNEFRWLSIGKDRVKLYIYWDPAVSVFLDMVVRIRDGEDKLTSMERFILEVEFDIVTDEEIETLIKSIKVAKSVKDLPFGEHLNNSIKSGMDFFEKNDSNEEIQNIK